LAVKAGIGQKQPAALVDIGLSDMAQGPEYMRIIGTVAPTAIGRQDQLAVDAHEDETFYYGLMQ